MTKALEKYSDKEIAEALVLPQKLTRKQQAEAAIQLAEARKKSIAKMTNAEKLAANLLQLKFQVEDYLKNDEFDEQKTFGYFLKQYLLLINRKRNEFAEDINIHETLLSQFVNNHREPGENIFVRLELHSNNIIPASYWYRLIEKQKENFIKNDASLRRREKKFVKNKVEVSY